MAMNSLSYTGESTKAPLMDRVDCYADWQKKEGAPTRRRKAPTARGKEAASPGRAKASTSRKKKEAGTARRSKTEES